MDYQLLDRVRTELTMSRGIALTDIQAARLCGVSPDVCTHLLVTLVEMGEMSIRADGRFVLKRL